TAWSRREFARRISVLRQAPPQVFEFSALELVLMGFHARSGRFALPTDRQRERALEAMACLDIRQLADRPATALSGGELQRALMARTMVAETDIWLLDEPTAHLDPRHQTALLEQMRTHVDDGGAAVCVLHDLSLVHRFFERVIVLDGGGVAARGPVDTTLDGDLLSAVYEVEMARGEVGGHTVWVPV
ncbi:MAG: ABC transporter ATP-binding protein, partial [Bradymonadaceae bacterium]